MNLFKSFIILYLCISALGRSSTATAEIFAVIGVVLWVIVICLELIEKFVTNKK